MENIYNKKYVYYGVNMKSQKWNIKISMWWKYVTNVMKIDMHKKSENETKKCPCDETM